MPDMTDVVGLMEFLSKRVQITPNTHSLLASTMNFQANMVVNYTEYLFCLFTPARRKGVDSGQLVEDEAGLANLVSSNYHRIESSFLHSHFTSNIGTCTQSVSRYLI